VSLLCDVRLNRDYTSKIIQAIALSDTASSSRLLLQYLRTAKPMLTEPDDMDTYILALAEDSLIDAWQYQRTYPDKSETRSRLAKKVLEWCFMRELSFSFFGVSDPGSSIKAKPRSEHLKQLICLPLTSFEQSLLHSFALEPPASFPASSIPVLQDLVCVRLIQSGQYLEAIKLDQQSASTRVGRGAQAQQAAERRRKMIEDVIVALPSIERQEIEEKLRAIGQRKPGALAKTTQAKAPAPTADMSMSWEEIPPPPRVPFITSGAPRFVLGRPAYGHNPPKVVAAPVREASSVPPVRPLLAPVRTQGTESTAPPGLNGASHARNYAPTLPLPSSRAGPKVGLFGSGPQTSKPPLNSSGSGSHRPSPLFHPKSTQPEESHINDSSSQKDVVVSQLGAKTRPEGTDRRNSRAPLPEPVPVIEFSEPVFLSSRPGPRPSEPAPYARETTEPPLPGAFHAEREVARPKPAPIAHSPPSPPKQLRPAKSRRTTQTSVPGGFDEDASGEEDNVPPLPEVSPVKRTMRRQVSRTSSNDGEDENAKPRRSSRLSAASSSSDPSPQKPNPPKTKRKTRGSAGSSATTGIASSTRSSTRKRR
jgi:hypothetical protein